MTYAKPDDVNDPQLASARFDDKDPLITPAQTECAWVSDVMAETLRRLDVRYIALTPGASYRGLHDSLVNHLGNRDPYMIVCLHEEHAVGIAHGYAKVTERPMAVALHSNVGLMHATMAIFNAWCGRAPILILGATGPGDAHERRPWIDWIHTAKDQGALIRHYTKWDDEPRSAHASVEALIRAYQIAATKPYGPTYVCLDVGLQETALTAPVPIPDLARFASGAPPAPSAQSLDSAAQWLVDARKPLILMGRTSRRADDWRARIALAESLGAAVVTDLKTAAAFPTHHPLHIAEPRLRPSETTMALTREADVILALDWIDLKGHFEQCLGKDAPVHAKVIQCTTDDFLHNGWSMDYFGLPPADLKIMSAADDVVRPLCARICALTGAETRAPKWPVRATKTLPAPADRPYMQLRDVALVVRAFCDQHEVTLTGLALGWPADTLNFKHPLDFVGLDGGGGVGAGPSHAIGTALALHHSGRLPLAVMGDGDFAMGCNAFWTAAHMNIPLLVVIANNRVYYNDVAHQERMAVMRKRPVANKFVGQEMTSPPLDFIGLARAQGLQGEQVTTARAFADALARGAQIVRAGGIYVIDALVDVRQHDDERGHTAGRRE
jgi:thiamine pyrophosphate-dependent acetolactate synthase large subunit-like protein